MSAGITIGILAGVVVIGVIAFIAYRNMNEENLNDEKQFMQDYPASKVTTSEPTRMSETNMQTPTQHNYTTLDRPSTKATPDPLAMSIAMLTIPDNVPPPSVEPKRYNFDPAQSTVNGAAPSTSPFNKKNSVRASRPSISNYDAHSMEFNAAPGSFNESYTESYAGSFTGSMAGSYAHSFSGTYNGQGVLNSFDSNVDDFGRDTVGTTVSEALDRQSQVPAGEEQSHWMDDMRGTNDSYAMLESGSFDRTSALSRFSTDSDLAGRPTN
ncbi:uncharacterized protein PHALS_13343 [Plasmopara halstedii]|uniref:Uncharacterized protein n=1 Tax=Plasmopara halstedii TaxID=4781 RepID=A0A0P1AQI6_PLAHL|nr:uncharacterized protein PHALS_13343 [Plasmopara halstedii]CEG43126.1 hypothetical protein PHALS_13343 [Plasmopara halstedii]|eukprot:XP_024579495.1 hypothetical protein PHALS_13343 [Plasmopara halstedii]